MNCGKVHKLLHLIAEGSSVAESDRLVVEKHLEHCQSCRSQQKLLGRLLDQLAKTGVPQKTDEQWASMHDAIFAQINLTPHSTQAAFASAFARILQSSHFTPRLAAAAILLVTLLGGLGIYYSQNRKANLRIAAAEEISPWTLPRIVALEGTAYSSEPGSTATTVAVWNKMESLQPLPAGTSLQTAQQSQARIQLDPGTGIMMKQNTRLGIDDYQPQSQTYSLDQGAVQVRVSKRNANQAFRIETPNAWCKVIGTRFSIDVERGSANQVLTRLTVYEGAVTFGSVSKAGAMTVTAGNTVEANGDALGTMVPLSGDCPLEQHIDLPIETAADLAIQLATFRISSAPENASVTIGGKYVGRTPVLISRSPGDYAISIESAGYTSWKDRVTLRSGADSSIHANLVVSENYPVKKDPKSRPAAVLSSATRTRSEDPRIAQAAHFAQAHQYDSSIALLLSLENDPAITIQARGAALLQAASHLRRHGEYQRALDLLDRIGSGPYGSEQKQSAIFESSGIRANAMSDYDGAVVALKKYIQLYPAGIWAEEAYGMIAEILLVRKHYKESAAIYQEMIKSLSGRLPVDKALYSLARIYARDLGDCSRAIDIYTRLCREYPSSSFSDDAFFWRADCLFRQGRISQALEEYRKYLAAYPQGKWRIEAQTRLDRKESALRGK